MNVEHTRPSLAIRPPHDDGRNLLIGSGTKDICIYLGPVPEDKDLVLIENGGRCQRAAGRLFSVTG